MPTRRATSPNTSGFRLTPCRPWAKVLAGQNTAMDAVHNGVIPANLGLAEAELMLAGKIGREMTMRNALREPKRHFDVILDHCPPTLGLLTVNALVAADCAILSTEAEHFSEQGAEQAMEVIGLARENLNPDLDLLGIVLNIADMRTKHARATLDALRESFGDKVFDTVIKRSIVYPDSACLEADLRIQPAQGLRLRLPDRRGAQRLDLQGPLGVAKKTAAGLRPKSKD